MHKEIVSGKSPEKPGAGGSWIDLEPIARVRLTSEEQSHPIESALREAPGLGWRAAEPGRQTIGLHFETPLPIRQIHLRFEAAEPRTQEFVLRWSDDRGATYRELVRQQFNFSPDGARIEEENYFPALAAATDLELEIVPDIAGGPARASLQEFRLR